METIRNCMAVRLRALVRHPYFVPALTIAVIAVATYLHPMSVLAAPFLIGTTLTEGQHACEFLAWEATWLKRESITVLSGQNLNAGAVIARVNKGVGRVSIPAVVGTGNGLASAVFGGPEIQVGNYVVTCKTAVLNGGVFSVVNPSGKALPDATVGTPYVSREINFTINDGATDFIVGDVFTFVVSTTTPTVVGTGNGTVSAITLGPDAKPGNYRVECIEAVVNGGKFKLVGPTGEVIAVGSIVAGAGGTLVLSLQRQLNVTITDAATDFVVGDFFNVTVFNNLASGKVVAWDPTTFDGRDDAVGVLVSAINASAADTAGVIVTRDAIIVKGSLQWGAAITDAQKESAYIDLASRGIIARDSVAQ
jgi:hypothetical protein